MWVNERISERARVRTFHASKRAPRRYDQKLNCIAHNLYRLWCAYRILVYMVIGMRVSYFLILKSFRCYCLCSFLAPIQFFVFFYFFLHLVAMVTITTTTHSHFHFVNRKYVHLLLVFFLLSSLYKCV